MNSALDDAGVAGQAHVLEAHGQTCRSARPEIIIAVTVSIVTRITVIRISKNRNK